MSAATLQLGPWPEGLNLTSNRDLSPFLAPTELGEATNVVLTPEGFVAPRPGCKVVTSGTFYNSLGANGTIKILGNVVLPDGTVCALVNVYSGGTSNVYKVFSPTHIESYFSGVGAEFTHVIQHTGITGHTGIIFCAKEDGKSFININQNLTTVPTLIPTTGTDPNKNIFPGSDGGMVVKDRLFLYSSDQSKIMWSPAAYILDWSRKEDAATVGDDVAGYENIEKTVAADGIMSVEFFNNSFYIFKKTKTYLFTYQTAPVDDGYLRKISNEFGALASTMYRGQIVVFNRKGVFRVDGTEFIDLQAKLNLRFEVPIDHNSITPSDVFVTDFNNDILVGYRDFNSRLSSPEMEWNDIWDDIWEPFVYAEPDKHYYCMNGYTGGWTRWDYNYNKGNEWEAIASPGSRKYICQDASTVEQSLLFTTFDKRFLVYMDFKPKKTINGSGTYHMDSNVSDTTKHNKYYIPAVTIKTKASIGGSMLRYKKIYRTFIRFYLSDQSLPNQKYKDLWIGNKEQQTDLWKNIWSSFEDGGLWTASINYNDYRFSVDQQNEGNYVFYLYPNALGKEIGNEDVIRPLAQVVTPMMNQSQNTNVYRRAYQLPIPQQRAVEFVFELHRRWTSITADLINPDTDRPIKAGYYFLLSGVWFDYNDKAGI